MTTLTSTNHKQVGILYGLVGTAMAVIGYILSIKIRLILTIPIEEQMIGFGIFDSKVRSLNSYNAYITLHGLVMIFYFVMLFIIGNYSLPIECAAADMALPRINNLSWWLLIISIICSYCSICLGGVASGWTLYPPLSTANKGIEMLVLAIHTIGLSSILGSINYMLTFRYKRGISLVNMRTSVFTWSLIATSILIILSVPVLAVAVTFILMDKVYGANYYDSGNGGDPLLYQHLF